MNDIIIIVIIAFVVAVDAPDVDVVDAVAVQVIADALRASARVAKGRPIVGVVDARSGVKMLARIRCRGKPFDTRVCFPYLYGYLVWTGLGWIRVGATERTVRRAGDDGRIRLLSYKNAIYLFATLCVWVCRGVIDRGGD